MRSSLMGSSLARPRRQTPFTAMRHILPLLVLALLASCVRPGDTARIPANPALAANMWQRFTAVAERAEKLAGPFRLNATLYYSGKEDSQRVTVYFWGNGKAEAPLPLRLDILMGPGSVMAGVREDARGLFIHVPRENTVYHAEGGGLLAFDVPVPFALKDLALLVTGRYGMLFMPEKGKTPDAFQNTDGTIAYAVDASSLGGYLTLGPDGLPLAWNDGTDNGWTLAVEYWPDSTRTTPRKLHIRHAEGREATLIVRDLAFPDKAFAPRQLDLAVPPETRLAPLEGTQ